MAFALYNGRETGAAQEWPPDHIFLLTPDRDVRGRIDGEALVEFVQRVEGELGSYCGAPPAPLDEVQIGCALLAGQRLVVEVQTYPMEVRVLHAQRITQRLRGLGVPLAELVDALESEDVSERQLDGAARLFAGNAFATRACPSPMPVKNLLAFSGYQVAIPNRQGGPAEIPVALRHRLLEHCLASGDEEKKRRARSAFADA